MSRESLRGAAHRQEMAQRRLRLVEIAQRHPARQEFGFHELFVHHVALRGEAVLGSDFIGRARMTVVQRGADVNPALDPPFLHVEQEVGFERRIEQ